MREAADDTSEHQPYHTDGAVGQSHLIGGEPEATLLYGVEHEGGDHLHQLRLGKAVEEHEEDGYPNLRLAEEVDEGLGKLTHHFAGASGLAVSIGSWSGQHDAVIQHGENEKCRQNAENQYPSGLGLRPGVAHTGSHDHQRPLPYHHRHAVEERTDPHKHALTVFAQSEHIKTVGGDIVGGGGEGHQPEHGQGGGEKAAYGEHEGYRGHAHGYHHLHGEHPPTLGADDIHEGAPEGLDDPRQIEPRGVEGEFGVADT